MNAQEKPPVLRLKTLKCLGIISLIVVCLLTLAVLHIRFRMYDAMGAGEDIYYSWLEGKRILSGENPYARVLAGDMRHNDKYATYLPLFYLLSALAQRVGLEEPVQWLCFWRYTFMLFHVGIGALIFAAFYRERGPLIALIASSFWLFNRWSLFVLKIAHTDPMALFFLVLSLVMFRKHRWASLFLFGVSLAIKHIAVFALPLYLIWVWESAEHGKARRVLAATGAIVSVPLLVSLPFLFWNPLGFLMSVLFSVTRVPGGHFGAISVDGLLGVIGIPGKLPMLALMLAVWYGALKRKIGPCTGVLLTMFAFLDFNSVLFRQYMAWVVPFIPLSLREWFDGKHADERGTERIAGEGTLAEPHADAASAQ